jgi:hypothetical protein
MLPAWQDWLRPSLAEAAEMALALTAKSVAAAKMILTYVDMESSLNEVELRFADSDWLASQSKSGSLKIK